MSAALLNQTMNRDNKTDSIRLFYKAAILRYILWAGISWALPAKSISQLQTALVIGRITDAADGSPLELASVTIKGVSGGVYSDEQGFYAIRVPTGQRLTLIFRRLAYREGVADILPLEEGARFTLDVALAPERSNLEVIVRDRRLDDAGMVRERRIEELRLLPTTTGNLESVLPHLALGLNTGTGGELTSQYQVRGGNYDENLVYVNDFEIYRPQLVRAGQQEGLSFPNLDLIRDLSFSSGGFQARYGDKLSSVLDIKYKRPDSLRASISASLLGANAHLEGSFKHRRDTYRAFRYLAGVRYKTTRNLLSSLDIRGEYVPDFYDIQTYLTYDLHRYWQIGVMANYNRAVYRFVPQSLARAFGIIDFALQLRSVFDGQEVDDFTQAMGGISLTYLPDRERHPLYHKFLFSTWRSQENERFDILSYYLLGQIESNLGSDEFGEIVSVLGTGTQHTWIRNYLTLDVRNAEYRGGIELQYDRTEENLTRSHFLQWGLKWQNEEILDKINEWERLDSALYSLPYDTAQLLVRRVLKTRNDLSSQRFVGFVQNTWTWRKPAVREWQLTAGLRGQYWSLNHEWFVTPRIQFLYKPLNIRRDISYRLAAGWYFQPAFYRELRRLDGTLNTNLRAQRSVHFVGGLTYDFLWGRRRPVKMRLIAEAYYKHLWQLVSFDIDNVRIRYSGENDSRGYAAGLDVRINGEFVPGAESWVNLSFLRTREALYNVQHFVRKIGQRQGTPVRDVPRPTDRFFTFSTFFQDYLPKNPNLRMHLNFTFGTGLPFGVADNNIVYRNPYRFKPYHRVDIGFGFQLWRQEWSLRKPKNLFRFTRNTWASVEIFNLMKVANEASHLWIKAITNVQYAVPNYLTGRRVNLRFRMDF
ncbi:MAG: TonB-dependent receptor [Saprospiraceae bacterium]|nr:TonB-dependent receptor [Saprospiraceae bacterium]MDW8482983.1 carboxypeptidase-like regulatory domain-containing protein [Saprospiraceae bacterium]